VLSRLGRPSWLVRMEALAARPFYVCDDPPVLRLELALTDPPLSNAAMATLDRLLPAIRARVRTAFGAGAEVLAGGLTPYIREVRAVADRDQRVVATLAALAIWIIVIGLVRDVSLSLFMILATLITYGTTLGLTHWLFVGVLGQAGVDWKVRLLLFVIIVAVGQDYNIFLVTRLLQERRNAYPAEAVWRAVVLTGPVISGCGLIMAATLGSLVVAVLENTAKQPMFAVEERVAMIEASLAEAGLDRVEVAAFDGLLSEFARRVGARVIVRGLRAVSDVEYELQMALMNRRLAPGLETLFLTAGEEVSFISSRLVREIVQLGGDVAGLVPGAVAARLAERFGGGTERR